MPLQYTPMIEQYLSIKNKIKDTILFFRLGDFYEMFFEDAKIASRVLDLTLTARDGGKGIKVPMAGLPYHAAENYINRLIKAGHKVAICEQVEDPHLSKGLVKREIVRTITPGTAVAHSVLDSKDNNFLASVNQFQNDIGISWADVSTGEFFLSSLSSYDQVRQLLSKFQIKEVILPEGLDPGNPLACLAELPDILITKYDCSCFIPDLAEKVLKEHFHVHALEGMLGTHVSLSALGAAGAIVNYLKELHKDQLGHINRIKLYTETDFMVLDSASERNLELVRNLRNQGRDCTLLSVLDETLTSMGARLLKRWILNPLKNMSEIEKRLDGVEEFREHKDLLLDVRDILRPINDMERIVGRLECGLANARDLLSLSQSIEHIKKLQSLSSPALNSVFENIKNKIPDLGHVKDLIDTTIREDAPILLRDGRLIKEGYDTDLDELRSIAGGGKDWIRNLQLKEIERTGIKSLKVRYNKVFGYYIEVTKTNMDLVPNDYIRKQTLVNAERFITPELKEKEALVLGAQEKIVGLEYDIFMKIRSQVCRDTKPIQKTSRLIAYADSLTGLATVAVRNGYVRPEITEDDTIRIEEGRHPVVEQLLEQGHFIANDTCFDHDQNRLLVITGPNMAGKSTYIRQVALITIMAQMGSFVPAKKANIGLVDRIFTRVGASDELSKGASTFMVEMIEVANILNNATDKSLIILDEVGRGTSTFDGVSIAWAVAEYIHDERHVGARTLFATHYHELTELELLLPKVKNYNISVKEWDDEIIFLRKIVPGGTDKSYGIHVARLAGLPKVVIERAKEILANLEMASLDEKGLPSFAKAPSGAPSVSKAPSGQLTFYQDLKHPIVEKIEKLDVDRMTPMEALQFISEIKKETKDFLQAQGKS